MPEEKSRLESEQWFVRNSYIRGRPGERFPISSDGVYMDGYAVVPIEDYDRLVKLVEASLEPGDPLTVDRVELRDRPGKSGAEEVVAG